MKIVSIWQPYASLIIHGHKFVETRSWKAPSTLIGKKLGIASTRRIKPEQTTVFDDPVFHACYIDTGLPRFDNLPHGFLLGYVTLSSCDLMTVEDISDITSCEYAFGIWEEGRYAWRLRNPIAFRHPIFVKGFQGIWDFPDEIIYAAEISQRED
jgi:activating signal cointegrator 1